MDEKVCKLCKIKKPIGSFYKRKNDKIRSWCIECENISSDNYKQTLNGVLRSLVYNAKNDSKKRLKTGRDEAGIFNIDFKDLEKLWNKQDGLCYYSHIKMNFNERDWRISLERLNPNLGYLNDNIVLCCREFNHRTQWSADKIIEMFNILDKNIHFQNVCFDLEKHPFKKRENLREIIIDNLIHYYCNHCNIIKPRDDFNQKISQGCKMCICIKDKESSYKPRNNLQLLIKSAKSHSISRSKKNHNKHDSSFDINFEYLIELFNNQKGLCAYSGLPLNFGNYLETNWKISLERIDILKGYIKTNICLTCIEFNVADYSILNKKRELSTGWSKEKFNYFIEIYKNYN